MTISDAIAAVRRAKSIHAETLPPVGPQREAWKAERELLQRAETMLLERLNAQREVRA